MEQMLVDKIVPSMSEDFLKLTQGYSKGTVAGGCVNYTLRKSRVSGETFTALGNTLLNQLMIEWAS